ncbi:hypothetical protein VTN77DRAFT_9024 [Rasamsonia byssochlamydoides]|uniref:uncharacterized protein n=1 Tax=Rasamsonia byssochlamydoides TaxID=89139 RepID=UPI0037439106
MFAFLLRIFKIYTSPAGYMAQCQSKSTWMDDNEEIVSIVAWRPDAIACRYSTEPVQNHTLEFVQHPSENGDGNACLRQYRWTAAEPPFPAKSDNVSPQRTAQLATGGPSGKNSLNNCYGGHY